jgi:DinB family protein
MTTQISLHTETPSRTGSERASALAIRLEEGARALIAFATGLTEAQWYMRVPHDNRTVGVVVHHVASVYPLEIEVAQTVAAGKPVVGVTMDDIHAMNAKHAAEYAAVTKETAIDLLRTNSIAAANAIRAFSDAELTQAAPVSLYGDAPLTSQFVLEDHAVRHSYHHLAILRRTVR